MQILSTCKTYPANESFPESVCSTQEKYKIHFKQMEEKYQILKIYDLEALLENILLETYHGNLLQ